MWLQTKIISDISWKEIRYNEIIHIYKNFWYNSNFDLWTLSIYTTKEELKEYFWKENFDNNQVWKCFLCNKNIIEEILSKSDYYFSNDLNWFIEYLKENTLTIEDLWIDLCNDCLKKYFGKFVELEE